MGLVVMWPVQGAKGQLNHVHPLSRRRRAQVDFLIRLTACAVLGVGLPAVILSLGLVAGWVAGVPSLWPSTPLQLPALAALVCALAPLVAIARLMPSDWKRRLFIGGLFVVGQLLFIGGSVGHLFTLPAWVEVLFAQALWVLPLVAVLSQFLFYRWLQAHYRRCDLV